MFVITTFPMRHPFGWLGGLIKRKKKMKTDNSFFHWDEQRKWAIDHENRMAKLSYVNIKML